MPLFSSSDHGRFGLYFRSHGPIFGPAQLPDNLLQCLSPLLHRHVDVNFHLLDTFSPFFLHPASPSRQLATPILYRRFYSPWVVNLISGASKSARFTERIHRLMFCAAFEDTSNPE